MEGKIKIYTVELVCNGTNLEIVKRLDEEEIERIDDLTGVVETKSGRLVFREIIKLEKPNKAYLATDTGCSVNSKVLSKRLELRSSCSCSDDEENIIYLTLLDSLLSYNSMVINTEMETLKNSLVRK